VNAPGSEAPVSPALPPRTRQRWITDWKIWLAFGVTGVALYWTLHDVNPHEVWRAVTSANPWLIAAMLPFHLLGLWMRAIRWSYLTKSISESPLPHGPLFRATAVGFMAINIFPLRIGEFVRPWLLARETGVRTSAALGTVVIERAIDFTTVAVIGGLVLYFHTQALPAWVRTGALLLAGLGMIPFGMTLAVRVNERGTLAVAQRGLSILPEGVAERALDVLGQLARGLGSLRERRDVVMVFLCSALLWAGLLAAPFALGLPAFSIELTPGQSVLAVYTLVAFTALAVAAPAAPGFFGVFHFACREALILFHVSPAVAVGYGTVVHLAYWIPVTLVGLISFAHSGLHLGDLASPPLGKAGSNAHR
jgi:uncharacterized protein (TIRG00374 family)